MHADEITLMPKKTRKKKIKMNIPHILDKIYNNNIYRPKDKLRGIQEIVNMIKPGGRSIIIKDTRDPSQKSPYSKNDWLCIFLSEINSRMITVPIWEGEDFLRLQTVYHSKPKECNTYDDVRSLLKRE